jgi:hypothetical protein
MKNIAQEIKRIASFAVDGQVCFAGALNRPAGPPQMSADSGKNASTLRAEASETDGDERGFVNPFVPARICCQMSTRVHIDYIVTC